MPLLVFVCLFFLAFVPSLLLLLNQLLLLPLFLPSSFFFFLFFFFLSCSSCCYLSAPLLFVNCIRFCWCFSCYCGGRWNQIGEMLSINIARHAGVLFGITNTAGTVPGMIAPLVAGLLTPNVSMSWLPDLSSESAINFFLSFFLSFFLLLLLPLLLLLCFVYSWLILYFNITIM